MKLVFSFLLIGFFSFASGASPICNESSGNSALIIIDMQPVFVTRGGNDQVAENRTKTEQIIKEQKLAIDQAKKASIPIVFLEYEGDYGDTSDTLKTAVANYKDVKFFKKNSDGMFESDNKYKKELEDYLIKRRVGTLLITGANGGACVKESIKGALDNNCNVIAYTKGIADFNFKDFIYPYAGHYAEIKPSCEGCSFKEVSKIDEIVDYMVSNSNRVSAKPSSYPAAGAQ